MGFGVCDRCNRTGWYYEEGECGAILSPCGPRAKCTRRFQIFCQVCIRKDLGEKNSTCKRCNTTICTQCAGGDGHHKFDCCRMLLCNSCVDEHKMMPAQQKGALTSKASGSAPPKEGETNSSNATPETEADTPAAEAESGSSENAPKRLCNFALGLPGRVDPLQDVEKAMKLLFADNKPLPVSAKFREALMKFINAARRDATPAAAAGTDATSAAAEDGERPVPEDDLGPVTYEELCKMLPLLEDGLVQHAMSLPYCDAKGLETCINVFYHDLLPPPVLEMIEHAEAAKASGVPENMLISRVQGVSKVSADHAPSDGSVPIWHDWSEEEEEEDDDDDSEAEADDAGSDTHHDQSGEAPPKKMARQEKKVSYRRYDEACRKHDEIRARYFAVLKKSPKYDPENFAWLEAPREEGDKLSDKRMEKRMEKFYSSWEEKFARRMKRKLGKSHRSS